MVCTFQNIFSIRNVFDEMREEDTKKELVTIKRGGKIRNQVKEIDNIHLPN